MRDDGVRGMIGGRTIGFCTRAKIEIVNDCFGSIDGCCYGYSFLMTLLRVIFHSDYASLGYLLVDAIPPIYS